MLGKLLKYEFKATGRMILPAYLGVMLFAIINRLFVYTDSLRNLFDGLILNLLILFYVLTVFAIVVLTFVLIVQRFYSNLIKDEGYLTHTLPVSTDSLIWGKALPAACWMIASCVILVLSIILMTADSDIFYALRYFFDEIGSALNSIHMSAWLLTLELVVLGIVVLLNIILNFYSVIAIGQIFSRHKVLAAVLAFFGMSFIFSAISSLISNVTNSYVIDFSGLVHYNVTGGDISKAILLTVVINLVEGAVYYLITRYLLKNRLNLE